MSFPRLRTELLVVAAAALAAVAAGAMPAIAAAPADELALATALRVVTPGTPAALAAAEAREARERRLAEIAHRRERRPDGPFAPVTGKVDYGTSENAFGAARAGHAHAGHDMFAEPGTPLVAVADGEVVDAGSDGGQGNYVHIHDPRRGQTYIYMHMIGPAKVETGDAVKAGEQVGGLGCTGSCYGDHLHFEIREGRSMAGEARDPLPDLKDWDALDKPIR